MMRLAGPILVFVLTAAIAFWLTLTAIPGRIMDRAMDRILASGATMNEASHPPPVDETARRIVRPSPDILYSICLYDLGDGPLVIRAPWPSDGGYASVSFFDDRTNNYAVVSDRDAGVNAETGLTRIRLVAEPNRVAADGERVVQSPSERGLILYRRVISATDVETADAERRAFSCSNPSIEIIDG